ncbi:MAG: gamma-glutamyltransferase [Balneolaceae bacterium]
MTLTIRFKPCLILLLGLLFSAGHTGALFAQTGWAEPYEEAVVVSAEEHASEAGLEILDKGGNAVDAAVAVQFALAVTVPRAGNIGGGGFMVIHLGDGTARALDFREKAPAAAYRDMYLDEGGDYHPDLSRRGALASGVPGTVDGMINALEHHGRLPLEVVMEPAIRLARDGYPLTYTLAEELNSAAESLSEFDSSKKYFVRENGDKWKKGDLFVQSDLAGTLQRIATHGRRGFYTGITAQRIVQEMRRNGGVITYEDLRSYSSTWREPVTAGYSGYNLIMMPPPSSGGIVIKQVLGMLDDRDLVSKGFNSADYIHLVSEAFRRSFADRNYYLGDPDHVDIPLDALTANRYYSRRMRDFRPDRATNSLNISHGRIFDISETDETTHFSIIDGEGNAVAVTTTLNGSFGSMLAVGGAGFLLNNEMDDFSAKPGEPNMFGLIGAEANAIEPGKRMLSSMSPTIVTKDGKARMIIGAAGGPRIITSTIQNFFNLALFGMNAREAINAPRFHHQWLPDQLTVEKYTLSADTETILEERNHDIELMSEIGRIHLIHVDEDGFRYGVQDLRGDGSAKGR